MIPEYPELLWLFHVPNGGARNAVTGARLKAEGVRRGVPDIFLDVARQGCHGLRIELKAKGGRLSAEQREWLAMYRREGYRADVCFGWEEARRMIEEYLG